jgi:dimethylaniline monooxygenase (N-oxide forming)
VTDQHQLPVCIIGAGSSGLVTAKSLQQRGVAFEGFEVGSDVGGMWRYQNDNGMSSAYRSLHIDTSRGNLGYPDHPIPETYPDFLSHSEVLEWLESYAERFELKRHFRFQCRVNRAEPDGDGSWRITLHDGEVRRYRAVIAANGHLWDARPVIFPGTFAGEHVHSHHYRTPEPFTNKNVLVIGIGNSAVDIAVDVCKTAKRTFLSTRRSAWVMPKYIMGIPVDRWSAFFARKLRLHATLSQVLLPYCGHGWIRIKPNVRALLGNEVEFDDGTIEPVDAIIQATGYRTSFPFLDAALFCVADDVPELYRRMTPPHLPGLYFIGLVQPVGPTIPLAELQARWLAAHLSGDIRLPSAESMKREIELHANAVRRRYIGSARYTLEVDAKTYSRQLARDLGRGQAAR